MPRRQPPRTELGKLARTDPDAARAHILDAIRAAKGRHAVAAEALGETPRSLYGLITGLFMWDQVDELHILHRWAVVTRKPD